MKQTAPKHSKAKLPRGRRDHSPHAEDANRATTGDFEREDMGIAPKE
jgi:hypothetical protein